jgi:hypothetical protein
LSPYFNFSALQPKTALLFLIAIILSAASSYGDYEEKKPFWI